MHVLADANAWISSRLFTSSIGEAVTFHLARSNGRLLLPEITEQELLKIARQMTHKATDDIEKVKASLSRFTYAFEVDVPGENEVTASVKERLAALKPLLVRLPTSEAAMRRALDRVLHDRAPSATKEQFRDALFWETACDFAARDTLEVVTNDSDFFAPGDAQRRIASELREDVEKLSSRVRIHPELTALLQTLKQEIPGPDPDKVGNVLDMLLRHHIEEAAGARGFRLSELRKVRISAFPTERPKWTAVSFRLIYQASRDATDTQSSFETTLEATGSCLINRPGKQYEDVALERLEVAGNRDFSHLIVVYRPPPAQAG